MRIEVVRSSKRRRTTSIQITSDGLRVLSPKNYPQKSIEGWILSHENWILKHFKKQPEAQKQTPIKDTPFILLGEPFILSYQKESLKVGKKTYSSWLEGNVLFLHFDSENNNQECYKKQLCSFLKQHAKDTISKRIKNLVSQSFNVLKQPDSISFGFPKTRWGSLSTKTQGGEKTHHLRINAKLLLFPLELLDAVLYHELCHQRHKGHGKDFWSLYERFVPNRKEINSLLKAFKSPIWVD